MTATPFITFLKSIDSHPLKVVSPSILLTDYCPIDLSSNNSELQSVDVSSSTKLHHFIQNHIQKHQAIIAYGGYLEQRNIYNRSHYFNHSNSNETRNIHLGLDLWIMAGTPVYAPLDGVVHSFANNTNYGDYGPTIILEHKLKGITFYTLYGHLSSSAIDDLKIGQPFQKGDQIATLGDATVNGDYPPHLHFQIIKDMQGYIGDYPGVCSLNLLSFYKNNCPDPNLLLKIS